MKPYTYNSDQQLIDRLLESKPVKKELWSSEEIKGIRQKIKSYYINEQGQTCPYCKVYQEATHHSTWNVEHIISRDEMPEWVFEPQNLCVSCLECNTYKSKKQVTKAPANTYKKFPKKSFNYKIIHPHFDSYEDHIYSCVPGIAYRFITDKGDATIQTCGLNRFHGLGGRKNVDPMLKALAHTAGDLQSEEMMQAMVDYIHKQHGIKANE
jgi:hypothetical protein